MHKAALFAAVLLLFVCSCCSASLVVTATPFGQQFVRAGEATETAQAANAAQATATAQQYALLHPALTKVPIETPVPTETPLPTRVPTPAPSLTAPPAIVTGATLDGPQAAFVAKYGAYDVNPGTSAAGSLFDVNGLTFSLNVDTGVDGQPHVFEMMVYKDDATTWPMAQAQSICRAFLPPDAKYQRETTNNDGDAEDVYTSAQRAQTFAPSSPWYDPVGTVSIAYVVRNGGVFQCNLEPFI